MAPNEHPIPLLLEDDDKNLAAFGLTLAPEHKGNWTFELRRTGFLPDHWMPRISTVLSDRVLQKMHSALDALFLRIPGERRSVHLKQAYLTAAQNDALVYAFRDIGLIAERWVFSGFVSSSPPDAREVVYTLHNTEFPNKTKWLQQIPNDTDGDYEIVLKGREISILLPAMQRGFILATQQQNDVVRGSRGAREASAIMVASKLNGAGYNVVHKNYLNPSFAQPSVMGDAVNGHPFGKVVTFIQEDGPSRLQTSMLSRSLAQGNSESPFVGIQMAEPPRLMADILQELGVEMAESRGEHYWIRVDKDAKYVSVHVGIPGKEIETYDTRDPEQTVTGSSTSIEPLMSVFLLDESGVKIFLPDNSPPRIADTVQSSAKYDGTYTYDGEIRHGDTNRPEGAADKTEGTWTSQTVVSANSPPSASTNPTGMDDAAGNQRSSITSLTKKVSLLSEDMMELVREFRGINDPDKQVPLRVLIGLFETIMQMLKEIDDGLRETVSISVLQATAEEGEHVSATLKITLDDQNDFLRRQNRELKEGKPEQFDQAVKAVGLARSIASFLGFPS